MEPLNSSVNQSTQVAFRIIEEMAAIGQPVELSVLARRLDMPKPRVFRFLRTLLSIGYVLQERSNDRYRLSLKVFHLGQAIADQTNLLSEARPVMVGLCKELGQTVTLAQPEDDGMRILDIVRAPSPIQIVTRPGSVLDFHSSAMGKLALAFGPPEYLQDIESRAQDGDIDIDMDNLLQRVTRVRRDGWSDAPGGTLSGINALSAPVLDAKGQLAATITIAGTLDALPSPPHGEQIQAVLAAARTLSQNLGHVEPSS